MVRFVVRIANSLQEQELRQSFKFPGDRLLDFGVAASLHAALSETLLDTCVATLQQERTPLRNDDGLCRWEWAAEFQRYHPSGKNDIIRR